MAELPWETMSDILSRLPVKSLARFRCVSKVWCNHINDPYLETMHAKRAPAFDPTLIVFHQSPHEYPNTPCTLNLLEHKEVAGTLKVRMKPPVMEFKCKTWRYRHPDDIVLGSCNGLFYSSKESPGGNTLVVINPLRRECYELPPINTPLHESNWLRVEEASGLGFDDSTNTFMMVCVVQALTWSPNFDLVSQDLCTMVHVLGSEYTWRKIPHVPSYPITGEAVFANGCLHWLGKYCGPAYLTRPVISFDMVKEEFGLINPPPQELHGDSCREWLVDFNGEVGYVYHILNCRIEVWVLKERGWVMHCWFKHTSPLSNGFIKFLGFSNENGDVLMKHYWKPKMFVYTLKGHSLHKVTFVGLEPEYIFADMRMYQSSLFSTRYSIKNLEKR